MYSGQAVTKLAEDAEDGFEKANNSSLNRLGADAGFDIN
jgi:hypothetical protein